MSEGDTSKITTTGTNTPARLKTILGIMNGGRRSRSVSLVADPSNSANLLVGRNGCAVMKLIPGGDITLEFAVAAEVAFNDQGTSNLVLYVDDSGPLDPDDLPTRDYPSPGGS